MSKPSRKSVTASVLLLTLAVLLVWYGGTAKPLTDDEVAGYMAVLDQRPSVFQSERDKQAFREFLEQDNGAAFYTVNFYKYRDQADYGHSETPRSTGREAFDRFSSVMVPLLVRQASHPIFGTSWIGANSGEFERLVIVRYRSRRDIAEVFTDPAFDIASRDKWAGIEKNSRFLAQGLHIPALPYALAAGALVVMIFSMIVSGVRGRRRPSSSSTSL